MCWLMNMSRKVQRCTEPLRQSAIFHALVEEGHQHCNARGLGAHLHFGLSSMSSVTGTVNNYFLLI